MPTLAPVGIPILIICGLAGIVMYERHTESADARKRSEHLKRWMHAQRPSPQVLQPPR